VLVRLHLSSHTVVMSFYVAGANGRPLYAVVMGLVRPGLMFGVLLIGGQRRRGRLIALPGRAR
jgi:hypothetical protein